MPTATGQVRIQAMLVLSSFVCASAFGAKESAPWQQATVLSIQERSFQRSPDLQCTTSPNGTELSTTCREAARRSIPYWEVTIKLKNQVLIVRPYQAWTGASGALAAFLSGLNGVTKDYVLPPGISPGNGVNVAIFSNGTVTLRNGKGKNYGEIGR